MGVARQSFPTASRCCNWPSKLRAQDFSRPFSTSLPTFKKADPVPRFIPTSSPELDALLANLRSRVFLPYHLKKPQRELVFRPENKEKLLSEPVYATLKGEQFRLEHIDITKDVPNIKRTVREAYKLMREKKDFDNLPSIFKGAYNAKFPIDTYMKENIVRAAVNYGQSDSILESIRQKGFTNQEYGTIASRLIWELQYQALISNWDEHLTKKALLSAEKALLMLYDNYYRPSRSAVDLRGRPEVVGQILELAAVRASRHLGGKDVDGKVEVYAKSLLATFENGIGQYRRDDHFLKEFVPVVYGIKVAETVLGSSSEVIVQLNKKAATIEKELHEKAAKVQVEFPDRQFFGMVVYDKLMSPAQANQ